MAGSRKLPFLGRIMQMAYLPSDFDAAIRYWTQVIGAGPFFLLPNMSLSGGSYRGTPSDPVFTMALGYWGDMQIELIRPENDALSIYSGEYGVRDRLHHICVLVDSIGDARQACADAGGEVIFEAPVGDEGGGVIYADMGLGAGNLVEMLQPATGTAELFAMMQAAHQNWDGSEPLRSLGG